MPVVANRWTMPCARCPQGAELLAPGSGVVIHPPGWQPYVVCWQHALVELVPEPAHVDELAAKFPRPDPHDPLHGKPIAPYPYQVEDARRIASTRALLIGSQMGTGKTPTTCLGGLSATMPNLIFCPASVKWNWQAEIKRWRPDLRADVAASKKSWSIPGPGAVTIASWGLLPPESIGLKHAVVLIADEVHYLQNASERRTKWDLLKDQVWDAGGRIYGLTGTVVSNTPWDLLEILKALNLDKVVFRDLDHFMDVFKEWLLAKKGERRAPTGELREELLRILRPVRICRLRKHVLKFLPPAQEKVVHVELTKQTVAEIDEAVQKMLAARRAWADVKEGLLLDPWGKTDVYDAATGKTKRGPLSEDEKERRVKKWEERVRFYYETRPWVTDEELRNAVKEAIESRHETPGVTELARVRALLALAKSKALLELVEKHEAEEEPCLVLSQHIGVLDKVLDGRKGWGIYHGGVSQKERWRLVQSFQSGEIEHGLGVSITAGGEGINLTRASSVLVVDPHWNPAKNDQAIARVLRPGAEIHDSITILRLVANHAVDRLLNTTLVEKGELHRAVEDEEMSQDGLKDLKEASAA